MNNEKIPRLNTIEEFNRSLKDHVKQLSPAAKESLINFLDSEEGKIFFHKLWNGEKVDDKKQEQSMNNEFREVEAMRDFLLLQLSDAGKFGDILTKLRKPEISAHVGMGSLRRKCEGNNRFEE